MRKSREEVATSPPWLHALQKIAWIKWEREDDLIYCLFYELATLRIYVLTLISLWIVVTVLATSFIRENRNYLL